MLCSLSPHVCTWLENPPIRPHQVRPHQVSCQASPSQLSNVFLLPPAAQGRTTAEKGQIPANYLYCPDDIQVQLVFYSTLEPMVLPWGGAYGSCGRAEAV